MFIAVALLGLAGAAATAAWNSHPLDALAFVAFLLASIFFVWRSDLPAVFRSLVVAAALINAGGWAWNYYHVFYYYDEAAHLLTAVAITPPLGILAFRPWLSSSDSWRALLAIWSLSMAVGGVWEIVEWIMFLITQDHGIIKSLGDTITDLILDAIGAALALPLILWQMPAGRP
jgi:hypothetical protein